MFVGNSPVQTEIEVDAAVCRAVTPEVVAEIQDDAKINVVGFPDEYLKHLVKGELSVFKKSHTEPIPLKIIDENIYLGGELVNSNKMNYVATICEWAYFDKLPGSTSIMPDSR